MTNVQMMIIPPPPLDDFNPLDDFCPGWLLSGMTFVRDAFCPGWLLSGMTFVQDDFCQWWHLSGMNFVWDDFCSGWLLSGMTFVRDDLCPGWLLSRMNFFRSQHVVYLLPVILQLSDNLLTNIFSFFLTQLEKTKFVSLKIMFLLVKFVIKMEKTISQILHVKKTIV